MDYKDDWDENEISLIADASRPGRLDGQVFHKGMFVTKFGVDFQFDKDGEPDGFEIDVPFRKACEQWNDDDVIGMIEVGIFDTSTKEFEREWHKARSI